MTLLPGFRVLDHNCQIFVISLAFFFPLPIFVMSMSHYILHTYILHHFQGNFPFVVLLLSVLCPGRQTYVIPQRVSTYAATVIFK